MHYTVNQWKLTALSEYSKYKNIFLLSQSFSKKSRVEKHLLKRRRRTAASSLNTRAKLNSLRNIWGIYLVIVLREGGGRGKPKIFIGCSHLIYAVWPISVNRVWVTRVMSWTEEADWDADWLTSSPAKNKGPDRRKLVFLLRQGQHLHSYQDRPRTGFHQPRRGLESQRHCTKSHTQVSTVHSTTLVWKFSNIKSET